MDITKLRALMTAADCGSLSAAAQRLGYTQSALTHMMNALESEAGVPLLRRGNRGVCLTQEGERLSSLMRALLQCDERLQQELALTRGLERGRISIGAYSSVSLHWLPQVLELFQGRYPGIEVELLEGSGAEMTQWLSEGRVDVTFGSLPPDTTFYTIKILEDPMLAVLPKNHPMAGEKAFPVEKFRGETFLAYTTSAGPDDDLRRAMELAGVPQTVKFLSNFDQTIVAMVEHNLGVTILPALIMEGLNADVAKVPLFPPISRSLGMAMRPNEESSPALRRFVSCALSLLRPGFDMDRER